MQKLLTRLLLHFSNKHNHLTQSRETILPNRILYSTENELFFFFTLSSKVLWYPCAIKCKLRHVHEICVYINIVFTPKNAAPSLKV